MGNVRVGERDKPGARGTSRGQEMGSTGTFRSTCSAGRTRTASIKHHAYSNYYRRGVAAHKVNGIAKRGHGVLQNQRQTVGKPVAFA